MNNLLSDDVNLDDYEAAESDNSRWVEQKTALDSLRNKPYFKTLIEEGYFKDYAFELVMSLIDGSVVREGRRNVVLEKLVGVAKLQEYFDMVVGLSTTEEGYQEEMDKRYLDEKGRLVKLASALEEAEKDKDFNMLVADKYCTEYAASQVSLLTNDHVVRGGHRTDVLEALAGISTLRNYLVDIRKDLANIADVDESDMEE